MKGMCVTKPITGVRSDYVCLFVCGCVCWCSIAYDLGNFLDCVDGGSSFYL